MFFYFFICRQSKSHSKRGLSFPLPHRRSCAYRAGKMRGGQGAVFLVVCQFDILFVFLVVGKCMHAWSVLDVWCLMVGSFGFDSFTNESGRQLVASMTWDNSPRLASSRSSWSTFGRFWWSLRKWRGVSACDDGSVLVRRFRRVVPVAVLAPTA